MNILKSRWLRWIVIVVALLAVAAYIALRILTPRHATPEQLSNEMRVQAQLTGPAKIYAATCAHCHDMKIGPILHGRNLPAEAINVIVRNGTGAMPSFLPSAISDAELAELAIYVSKLPPAKAK